MLLFNCDVVSEERILAWHSSLGPAIKPSDECGLSKTTMAENLEDSPYRLPAERLRALSIHFIEWLHEQEATDSDYSNDSDGNNDDGGDYSEDDGSTMGS